MTDEIKPLPVYFPATIHSMLERLSVSERRSKSSYVVWLVETTYQQKFGAENPAQVNYTNQPPSGA